MAKYSIEETTLTNIANPLRTLRGLTGGMTPEEMAANANAVQANVIKAFSAVAAKGVIVPTDANSDDLESLILSIADGTASGGSEIKTCTLRITVDIPFVGIGGGHTGELFINYSKFVDGVITHLNEAVYYTTWTNNVINIEDVVSGYPIAFEINDNYIPAILFAYDGSNRMLDSMVYGSSQDTHLVYIPRDAQGVFDITLTEEYREPAEPEPDEPDEAIALEQTDENSVTVSGVAFEQQEDDTVLWDGVTFTSGEEENTVIIE